MRRALGGTPRRLFGHFLIENILLTTLGGIAGLLCAAWFLGRTGGADSVRASGPGTRTAGMARADLRAGDCLWDGTGVQHSGIPGLVAAQPSRKLEDSRPFHRWREYPPERPQFPGGGGSGALGDFAGIGYVVDPKSALHVPGAARIHAARFGDVPDAAAVPVVSQWGRARGLRKRGCWTGSRRCRAFARWPLSTCCRWMARTIFPAETCGPPGAGRWDRGSAGHAGLL